MLQFFYKCYNDIYKCYNDIYKCTNQIYILVQHHYMYYYFKICCNVHIIDTDGTP